MDGPNSHLNPLDHIRSFKASFVLSEMDEEHRNRYMSNLIEREPKRHKKISDFLTMILKSH